MSPNEIQLLRRFLDELVAARGVSRDPQAAEMIADAVARQPDATYLLTQRALILEQALEAARAQIGALQRQIEQQQGRGAGGGFLDANTWGNSGTRMPAGAPPSSMPASVPQPLPSSGYGGARMGMPGMLGGGSFLGTMAATAAGVAGGEFLFHGLENLFGRHEGEGGQAATKLFDDNSGGMMPEGDLFQGGRSDGDNRQSLFGNADDGGDATDAGALDNAGLDDQSGSDDFVDDGSSYDDDSTSI
ncbi:MAG: DUF2076 domain-containing protein [Burkholderiaceae bacterium]